MLNSIDSDTEIIAHRSRITNQINAERSNLRSLGILDTSGIAKLSESLDSKQIDVERIMASLLTSVAYPRVPEFSHNTLALAVIYYFYLSLARYSYKLLLISAIQSH